MLLSTTCPPSPHPPYRAGVPARGIAQSDVSHAADSLLRSGERPTIDKVRAKIGKGSPNTINPMLDAWWKTLSARLDSGPAALHRLPEPVAHIAEALWMQALEEARRRAALEQRDSARLTQLDKERLELRSHVLSLREGELDSRLHERERTIDNLNQRLRELTLLLRKEQATRESQALRLTTLESKILAQASMVARAARSRTPSESKREKRNLRSAPRRRTGRPPATKSETRVKRALKPRSLRTKKARLSRRS